MWALRTHILSAAFLMLAVLTAAPARAQLAVSATIDSDYRFRGLTLSQGPARPAPQPVL